VIGSNLNILPDQSIRFRFAPVRVQTQLVQLPTVDPIDYLNFAAKRNECQVLVSPLIVMWETLIPS
jgi:hypothetical protein